MTNEYYTQLRHDLVREFLKLRNIRCYLAAKARVRKIADLDFEQKGTPREETLKRFNYDMIGIKNKQK